MGTFHNNNSKVVTLINLLFPHRLMREIPIGFQGILGAYSHEAIETFGNRNHLNLSPVPALTFDMLFNTVIPETGLGMVPIENSTAGIVFPAMDLLLKHDLEILGELYLPVRHNLLGWGRAQESSALDDILDLRSLRGKNVHSHWQAINQCKDRITDLDLTVHLNDDTAGAAQYISQLPEAQRANHFAIASKKAAELYGLSIIVPDLQDNNLNTTRFLIVKPTNARTGIEKRVMREKNYKATISFSAIEIKRVMGYLMSADKHGFKLLTIHERPDQVARDPEKVFNRAFYSDISIPSNKLKAFHTFYDKMAVHYTGTQIRLVGVYPAHHINLQTYPHLGGTDVIASGR
jgi:prephenate dehydratase